MSVGIMVHPGIPIVNDLVAAESKFRSGQANNLPGCPHLDQTLGQSNISDLHKLNVNILSRNIALSLPTIYGNCCIHNAKAA